MCRTTRSDRIVHVLVGLQRNVGCIGVGQGGAAALLVISVSSTQTLVVYALNHTDRARPEAGQCMRVFNILYGRRIFTSASLPSAEWGWISIMPRFALPKVRNG
jgi:hypothetical protein